MAHRHLSKDGSCLRCPSSPETVNHLLFQCTFARLVWAMSPIAAPMEGVWGESVYENLYVAMTIQEAGEQDNEVKCLTPWILWRLWKNRNELMYKGKEYDALEVVKKAKADAEEWATRRERVPVNNPHAGTNRELIRWKRPPAPWLKCNTDGSWSADMEKSGVGWSVWDHEGKIIWMGARVVPRVKIILETEMEALRWAMVELSKLNYKRIIFESDSQQLISLVKGNQTMSSFASVIQDIQLLSHKFEDTMFEFVNREGNGVADRIAGEASSFMYYVPKLYSVMPDWVKNVYEKFFMDE